MNPHLNRISKGRDVPHGQKRLQLKLGILQLLDGSAVRLPTVRRNKSRQEVNAGKRG